MYYHREFQFLVDKSTEGKSNQSLLTSPLEFHLLKYRISYNQIIAQIQKELDLKNQTLFIY